MIGRAWKLLSERGDPSREDGRAHERQRRILLSALASGGAKALSMGSLLLSVPLTLSYLGAERFGLWSAVSSLLGVLGFADLGLGYGLVNALSSAEGSLDRAAARRAVSSAFFLLAALALAVGLALVLGWSWLDWGNWLNARSEATRSEAGAAAAVFLACFLIGLPLSVVNHGFAGLQEGFWMSAFQGLGSLLGLGALLLAIHAQAGLPTLVLAASGAPLLGTLLGGALLFFRRRPDLRPTLAEATPGAALALARLGGLFFVIQVAVAVSFQADSLVLARILGPEAVAGYSVAQKLFMQVPFILGFVLNPLWPAYSEAKARGDAEWIRRSFRRSLALGLAVNPLAGLLLFLAAPALIGWWVSSAVQPPTPLLAALAVWAGLNGLNGPLAMLYNGLGALRYQALAGSLMAAANLALSIYFTRRLGVAGVVLGSITAQVLFSYLPALVVVPRLLRGLKKGSA